jgi:hypothetical protein
MKYGSWDLIVVAMHLNKPGTNLVLEVAGWMHCVRIRIIHHEFEVDCRQPTEPQCFLFFDFGSSNKNTSISSFLSSFSCDNE